MKLITVTENYEPYNVVMSTGKAGENCYGIYTEYDEAQIALFRKQADQYICCVSVNISDYDYSEAFFQRIPLDESDYVIKNNKLYGFYIKNKPFAGSGLLYVDMSNSTYRHGWDNRGCYYDEIVKCFLIPSMSIDFPFADGDRWKKNSDEFMKIDLLQKKTSNI